MKHCLTDTENEKIIANLFFLYYSLRKKNLTSPILETTFSHIITLGFAHLVRKIKSSVKHTLLHKKQTFVSREGCWK